MGRKAGAVMLRSSLSHSLFYLLHLRGRGGKGVEEKINELAEGSQVICWCCSSLSNCS